jgi:hypothetical protein
MKRQQQNMYSLPQVAEMTGEDYGTVWARANSKYAKQRWGVEKILLPDGSYRKFVPPSCIHLWLNEDNMVGRPTNEEIGRYEE